MLIGIGFEFLKALNPVFQYCTFRLKILVAFQKHIFQPESDPFSLVFLLGAWKFYKYPLNMNVWAYMHCHFGEKKHEENLVMTKNGINAFPFDFRDI